VPKNNRGYRTTPAGKGGVKMLNQKEWGLKGGGGKKKRRVKPDSRLNTSRKVKKARDYVQFQKK